MDVLVCEAVRMTREKNVFCNGHLRFGIKKMPKCGCTFRKSMRRWEWGEESCLNLCIYISSHIREGKEIIVFEQDD